MSSKMLTKCGETSPLLGCICDRCKGLFDNFSPNSPVLLDSLRRTHMVWSPSPASEQTYTVPGGADGLSKIRIESFGDQFSAKMVIRTLST